MFKKKCARNNVNFISDGTIGTFNINKLIKRGKVKLLGHVAAMHDGTALEDKTTVYNLFSRAYTTNLQLMFS